MFCLEVAGISRLGDLLFFFFRIGEDEKVGDEGDVESATASVVDILCGTR